MQSLFIGLGAVIASALPWMLTNLLHLHAQAGETRVIPATARLLGLLSIIAIHNKFLLLLTMVGVGIAWISILAIPYAVLAGSLPPQKTGVYMGIFNFFIVIPENLASLFFGWIMNHLLNNNRIAAVVAGGFSMLVAAALMQRVIDAGDEAVHRFGAEPELQTLVAK